MQIDGKCHCGNISYVFDWPGEDTDIPVRTCGCSFCIKHGGVYTSHRNAALTASIQDQAMVTRYKFGTETAEFYLCARCGVMTFVTSMIEENLYAVVNVNSFEAIDSSCYSPADTDFEGETTESRLDRRKSSWIPSVTIAF